ncbi:DUF4097 family beta strand repeat-containing protein [Fulvivirgaceae bacterium BMA12]|uniref:DUF4097 family beta strand repeat-containing protein n=1 Tax=Agaribacillus aureus TaxID=3051825 RepID=A0ABT8L313_9BACT|nr:DUF4097 family beta strand repeat-containing protein [Fulvivirgaceae bacterium BMA12]
MKIKIRLLLFSLFTICLVYFSEAKNGKNHEYRLDKVFPIAADGTLNLKTDDADIRIIGSSRKDVHLRVFRSVTIKGVFSSDEEDFKIDVEEMGGDLIIRELKRSRSRGLMIYSDITYKITIEVPNTVSLKLRGDDDDYDIRNVHGFVKIDVEDGDVILDNCQGNKFDINIEDGDVEMSDAKGSLWISLDDGDLIARNCQFKEVDIRANDGDIKLETSLVTDGGYNLKTDDGNINLKIRGGGGEFEIRHDDGRVRASSDFEMAYSGDTRHQFRLAGGKAKVFLRTNDGSVHLNTY